VLEEGGWMKVRRRRGWRTDGGRECGDDVVGGDGEGMGEESAAAESSA
jgi:hypothetical protein